MTEVPMDPEDLLILARRGGLSGEQQEALDAAAEDSVELVDLLQAGLAFDEESAAQAGDDELCRRLAEGALRAPVAAKRSAPPRAGRRSKVVWIGLGVFVASSAAAAAWGVLPPLVEVFSPSEVEESGARSRTQAPGKKGRAQPLPQPSPSSNEESAGELFALPEEEPRALVLPEARRAEQGEGSGHRAARGVAQKLQGQPPTGRVLAESSSGEIYRRANELRREGQVGQAVSLYRQLQKEYPGSSEARVAALPLGELSLREGNAREALEQFSRYRGALRAEALWGRTRALRALGRLGEERGALKELNRLYPSSAFAQAASRRLEQLALQDAEGDR